MKISLLRPDDLLALDVEVTNVRLDSGDPTRPRLVRDKPRDPVLLIFTFQPQSITEQAFFETPPFGTGTGTFTGLPLPGQPQARMSGVSRLVFRLPDQVTEIPYATTDLLDWSQLEPVLPPAAQVPDGASSVKGQRPPDIAEPSEQETAIELPYRLLIAPNVTAHGPAWQHATIPVTHGGRTELWHTRLAVQGATAPVRVVWSPDFTTGPLPSHSTDDVPFLAPLTPRDRDQITILSAAFSGYTLTEQTGTGTATTQTPYVPRPVQAEQLFLSALGGWLTSSGAWPSTVSGQDATLDLVEWDHVATQGRDHYVRVVYEGFLYPFGNKAALVKVTERKVLAPQGSEGNPATSPVAYLRQHMYIVVREREKTYPVRDFVHHGREMPLNAKVTVNVHVTPDIDQPVYIPGTSASFWIYVGQNPYPFPMTGLDLAGAEVDFDAPLVFVSASEGNLAAVRDAYASSNSQRRCAVQGRGIAYADPADGDTVLKTASLYFTAQISTAPGPYAQAPFVPTLDCAAVTVPSLTALIGQNTPILITLYARYLERGIDAHAGVFAEVVGVQPPVAFSADKAGGFARPNIKLSALSARKGLVAGALNDAAENVFKPSQYFGGGLDAQLFGTVNLGQLIPIDGLASDNAPEIRTRAIPNRRNPRQLNTVINWSPNLKDYNERPVSILFNQNNAPSNLTLQVHLETHLNGTPPVSRAHGELTNFQLSLLGIIALNIGAIHFDSANGAKSTVTLQLAPTGAITFHGPLQFVQTLAQILPPGLFGGSGPQISFTPTALRVAYTIGLPPIPCGVFSLQNISILAALDLPYLDGKPAVEFGFAARSRPFLVTVEIFGGGGFVHVVLDTDGVRMVEGAIEFGATFGLNLGVASGSVSAMAGIYFQLKGHYSDLTGFVDICGEVSVLGLISISMDLNISLSWKQTGSTKVIEGRATLTVSVHVLFFSASVQLSVERSFSAGNGDPDFGQVVSQPDWHEYAGAFA